MEGQLRHKARKSTQFNLEWFSIYFLLGNPKNPVFKGLYASTHLFGLAPKIESKHETRDPFPETESLKDECESSVLPIDG